MKVKIKKLHPDAVIPAYSTSGSAGMDLTAVSKEYDEYGNVHYGFGLAFEIPEGYVGLIFPRSSCAKFDLSLSNAVGMIDSDYRGEVTAKFKPTLVCADFYESENRFSQYDYIAIPNDDKFSRIPATHYNIGDRVAQMIIMPYPKIEWEEVDELSETERNNSGYGSTGIK